MFGGDGTASCTQVLVVRCVWVPVTMSHNGRHTMSLSPEDPALAALPSTKRLPSAAELSGARVCPELGYMEDL
jgi:hypothetical protein